MNTYADKMRDAYLECAYWTDAGPDNPENENCELTALFNAESWAACRRFVDACREMSVDYFYYDPAQVGHDLWLTRNGHGAGFWDRPEVYGQANATLFTAFAKAQGEHYSDFEPEGNAK